MFNKLPEIESKINANWGGQSEVDLYMDKAGTGKIYADCEQSEKIVCDALLTLKAEVPLDVATTLSKQMTADIMMGVSPYSRTFELTPIVEYVNNDPHQPRVKKVVLKSVSTGRYQIIIDPKTFKVLNVLAYHY